jgi:glycosyltransferase involved in cell wall biosynthesis
VISLKVAIVHEWLATYAGSERVVEQMLKVFPDADLFSLVDFIDAESRGFLQNKPVRTSFLQKLPWAEKKFRNYLPLMPLAIEQFDLSGYDLILSSSHAVAKGVLTGPGQIHISYIHTPIRYAWDMQHQYLRETGLDRGLKGNLVKLLLHYMRIWDCRTANGIDYMLANSKFIAQKIWKCYRREATVIYPPVDVAAFTLEDRKADYYFTASRMVPYKKIDLIVEAFSEMPGKKLVVIGDGSDFNKIKAKAGSNIELLGYQPFRVLKKYMQHAKAFVFAGVEDFGIIPVEAQACGTPVIAYGRGGVTETVLDPTSEAPTGVFFPEQSVAALKKTVAFFEKNQAAFSPEACRANAEKYAPERFREDLKSFVDAHSIF